MKVKVFRPKGKCVLVQSVFLTKSKSNLCISVNTREKWPEVNRSCTVEPNGEEYITLHFGVNDKTPHKETDVSFYPENEEEVNLIKNGFLIRSTRYGCVAFLLPEITVEEYDLTQEAYSNKRKMVKL